ncbi:MAG: M81 family metallopeptidase [Candidatus Bathyarchaeota archaeon]|nr:M81 family metallopeptidase [Candidatus Bathyarchaeota archaeon]
MRIVTGTISHETNVLSNISTGLTEFKKRRLYYGDELFTHFKGTKTPAGGIIQGCKVNGYELVPTVFASATPSGTINSEAFDTLLNDILEGIRNAGDIDAAVLHLHGAGVSENYPDIEGKVLKEVRALVGSKPLAATFDLHANYTNLMVESADILIGYDTYPHVDGYERGVEAVNLTAKMLDGSLTPKKSFKQPPMLPALQVQFTGRPPMSKLISEAHRMEEMQGVETITVAAGFPWSDIHEAGMSFIVTTNDDQQLADSLAQELHDMAWNMRRDFLVKPTPMKEAFRQVKTAKETPIVLADIGDNPGGGAPEDGTVVLKAILKEGLSGGVLALIWDPDAVDMAIKAGIGETIEVMLGGHTDEMHGAPVKVTGKVKVLSDGKFINEGPMGTGSESDSGPTAVLEIGGNDVIVTTKRIQPLDLALYKNLGIDVTEKKFVVVKSSVHFRASHEPVAAQVIELDTPGLTSPRLAGFGFKNIRRPIFPLDIEMLGITELKSMDEP